MAVTELPVPTAFIPGEEPEGWIQGNLIKATKKWFNNGIINKMFLSGEEPQGWTLGRHKLGKKWYSNGTTNGMFIPGYEPPGWVLGRTFIS